MDKGITRYKAENLITEDENDDFNIKKKKRRKWIDKDD